MNLSGIVEHMNSDHSDALLRLAQKYGNENATTATMTSVDASGIELCYNGDTNLRLSFPAALKTREDIVAAIIVMCQNTQPSGKNDSESVKKEIESFKQELGSIILASVDKQGKAVCSYAPLISANGNTYIYISEVAEHYASIVANPDKLQILYLEDESKTQTLLARKRVVYRAKASFVERNCAEFESALDAFERGEKNSGAKMVRKMGDFHLIRLTLSEGRFVKGFGQAYDIDETGKVSQVGGTMPHKMPHK